MDTSDPPFNPFNALASLHHHHCHHHWFHHHHHYPLFTIIPHWFQIPNSHFHVNPPFAPLHIPLLPESNINSVPKPNNGTPDLMGSEIKQSALAEDTQLLEGFEEEDDGEPVFVMTDEWVEFFAKSEAKRKLEKKLAKKNKRKSGERVEAPPS